MANYAGIKAAIDAQIKLNGQNAITGNILNGVLNQMVDVLAEGYQLMGVATISDTPAVGDSNIAYLAGPGTYTNYGGLEVPDLCVGVLKYNGTLWSVNYTQIVDLTDYATKTYVNGLLQDAIDAAAAANAAAELANDKAALVQGRLNTADEDHTRAGQDHETAVEDHGKAENDHTRAGEDHTQAGDDHTRAGEDHALAVSDHDTAVEDHTVVEGYNTRLTNVEGEVSQLDQEVDELLDSFDVETISPVNLFDFNGLTDGYYWTNGAHESGTQQYTAKMPVESGKVYTYQVINSQNVRAIGIMRFVVAFDSAGNIVANASDASSPTSYTPPQGVTHVIITVATVTSNKEPEFVQSSVLLPYTPYFTPYNRYLLKGAAIQDGDVTGQKLAENSVGASKIQNGAITLAKSNFSFSKNKINTADADVQLGYIQYQAEPTANASFNLTGYIPVEYGKSYAMSNNDTIAVARFVAYFNVNKVFQGYASDQTIITPASGIAFVRLSVSTSYWATAQMEEGVDITPYSSYKLLIKEDVLPERIPYCSITRKAYVYNGLENSIYYKSIYNFLNDLYFIRASGWDFRERCARAKPDSSILNLDLYRNDGDMAMVYRKAITTIQGYSTTNHGALKVNCIGDSFTYGGVWYEHMGTLCPELTFVGMRKSHNVTDASMRAEGRGGWTLNNYVTKQKFDNAWYGFSPFVHPSGYKYYGVCEFWAAIVNGTIGTHTYEQNGYDDFVSWFGTDGKKINPSANDMMYDATNDRYIYYNGSAWVDYSGVPTFDFNYATYIATWGIASPDIVFIMLGTNDYFSSYSEEQAATWKEQMNAVISSIQSYATSQDKTIKIAICTNPTIASLPNSNYNVQPLLNSRNLWQGRKNTIKNFDTAAKENAGVYVVDTGAVFDIDYGYQTQAVKPFDYYEGEAREVYDFNGVHPSSAGYKQMGQCAAAFVQAIR